VDVIIMDERFKSFSPQLAFLFEQPTLKDLIPIFTIQNERGSKIILYQLKP
jgi:hypothetical protein